MSELKPCPFCGADGELPSGDGTQYEIWCSDCGQSVASTQISDLMTLEERKADKFTNHRYAEEYIERAKAHTIEKWNTRTLMGRGEPARFRQIGFTRIDRIGRPSAMILSDTKYRSGDDAGVYVPVFVDEGEAQAPVVDGAVPDVTISSVDMFNFVGNSQGSDLIAYTADGGFSTTPIAGHQSVSIRKHNGRFVIEVMNLDSAIKGEG